MKVDSRPSCREALNHSWFDGKAQEEDNTEITAEALANFKKYRAEAKLQQATLSYIVT